MGIGTCHMEPEVMPSNRSGLRCLFIYMDFSTAGRYNLGRKKNTLFRGLEPVEQLRCTHRILI